MSLDIDCYHPYAAKEDPTLRVSYLSPDARGLAVRTRPRCSSLISKDHLRVQRLTPGETCFAAS